MTLSLPPSGRAGGGGTKLVIRFAHVKKEGGARRRNVLVMDQDMSPRELAKRGREARVVRRAREMRTQVAGFRNQKGSE